MILMIDTSDFLAKIALLGDNFSIISERNCKLEGMLSDNLLIEIDKLLKESKATKNRVEKIFVNHGPGSYTGLRIGVTAANFLGYSLNVPVFGFDSKHEMKIPKNKLNERNFMGPIVPYYQKPPHITKPHIAL